MNVTHLTTYSHYGGAGIACSRLSDALNRLNPHSSMVMDKDAPSGKVDKGAFGWNPPSRTSLNFAADIAYGSFYGVRKEYQFMYSSAKFGVDRSHWERVGQSDILHLHWINQGFLSLKNLAHLAELGKPIVWTLHDMWAFSGGCHYAGDCTHYQSTCGNCFMQANPRDKDLSFRLFKQKKVLLDKMQPRIVTCSHWLAGCARKSALLGNYPIQVIPNPIDTDQFKPANKGSVREEFGWGTKEFIVVMNAFKISNERKGFRYLVEALHLLSSQEGVHDIPLRLVLVGKSSPEDLLDIAYPTERLGYIEDIETIIRINQAADLYLTPSVEDNLPNTIMEALSCGLPTVAYNIGGIPDLIDHHQTGYLAQARSPSDFAAGITWVYETLQKPNTLTEACLVKARNTFSYAAVAPQYQALYDDALQGKRR